jgi:hypothetical protein
MKDIYNARQKIRTTTPNGRTSIQVLVQQLRDNNCAWDVESSPFVLLYMRARLLLLSSKFRRQFRALRHLVLSLSLQEEVGRHYDRPGEIRAYLKPYVAVSLGVVLGMLTEIAGVHQYGVEDYFLGNFFKLFHSFLFLCDH